MNIYRYEITCEGKVRLQQDKDGDRSPSLERIDDPGWYVLVNEIRGGWFSSTREEYIYLYSSGKGRIQFFESESDLRIHIATNTYRGRRERLDTIARKGDKFKQVFPIGDPLPGCMLMSMEDVGMCRKMNENSVEIDLINPNGVTVQLIGNDEGNIEDYDIKDWGGVKVEDTLVSLLS